MNQLKNISKYVGDGVQRNIYLYVMKCLLHFVINYSLMSAPLVGGFFFSAFSESQFQPQPSVTYPQLSGCSQLFSAVTTTGLSPFRLTNRLFWPFSFLNRQKGPSTVSLTHLLSFPYGRRRKKRVFQSHHMSPCQQFNCSLSNHGFYCRISNTHCLLKVLRVTEYFGSRQEWFSKKANIFSRANYY